MLSSVVGDKDISKPGQVSACSSKLIKHYISSIRLRHLYHQFFYQLWIIKYKTAYASIIIFINIEIIAFLKQSLFFKTY